MALARAPDLLLFVAGEPETTPGVREAGAGVMPRMTGMVFGAGVRTPSDENSPMRDRFNPDKFQEAPLSEERPWHLPPEQTYGLDQVLTVAGERGKTVGVIDVDRPGDQQSIVERWVGPNDVLPILVRADGEKISGAENFTRAKLLRFIRPS